MSFLSAIESEIADLERKLLALRAARAAYMGAPFGVSEAPSGQASQRPADPSRQAHFDRVTRVLVRRARKNAEALEAAKEYLRLQGRATPTQEVYDYIVEKGIEISGKQPRNTLSAMLSNSPEFTSIDRKGWMLTGAAREVNEAAGTQNEDVSEPAAPLIPLTALSPVKPWAGGGT
jgi:hypothetical protein